MLTGLVAATACSDGTGPADLGTQRVDLMIGVAPRTGPAASETFSVGGHDLVVDKVELVLSRIRLKRADASVACGDQQEEDDDPAANASSGTDDPAEQDDDPADVDEDESNDECEKFVAGPVLVDLPLDGQIERLISIDVDAGTYRRVEFKLHKVSDDAQDAAFLAEHPDLEDVSVRVTGTFDGEPFTYVSDVTAHQKSTLDPPLVVSAAGATDLTFLVDLSTWFVAPNGDLIDPRTADKGQANGNRVRQNIIHSFHLFKDHGHDGKEDDD